ncbi:hypothetical protein C8J56DRAFT_1055484 [Mycena floridula]|nr:hypothetical protein C8J56DRAFT_1055484 [Mycena floridula]
MEVDSIHAALQPMANYWRITHKTSALLERVDKDLRLREASTAIDSKVRFFLVVILGKSAGIFMSQMLARTSLNQISEKSHFCNLIIYSSFKDALKGMLTGSDHDPGKLFRGVQVPDTWPGCLRGKTSVRPKAPEAKGLQADKTKGNEPQESDHDNESQKRQLVNACIRRLVKLWAPPHPPSRRIPLEQAKSPEVEQHWYLAVLCFGKGADFENIARWVLTCTHSSCQGHFCSGFGGFLTSKLQDVQLAKLRELKDQYDATGKRWGATEPVEHREGSLSTISLDTSGSTTTRPVGQTASGSVSTPVQHRDPASKGPLRFVLSVGLVEVKT